MKTAISVPNDVFQQADNFARRQRLSRSALFTQAVIQFLSQHRRDHVTEQLNSVYGAEDSKIDPLLTRLQSHALPKDTW